MNTIKIDLQDRNFFQNLRRLATIYAEGLPNEAWARAYIDLADAADKLDAMHARTEVHETSLQSCGCGAPDCDCDKSTGCKCEDPDCRENL